jgi:hypothetical protein
MILSEYSTCCLFQLQLNCLGNLIHTGSFYSGLSLPDSTKENWISFLLFFTASRIHVHQSLTRLYAVKKEDANSIGSIAGMSSFSLIFHSLNNRFSQYRKVPVTVQGYKGMLRRISYVSMLRNYKGKYSSICCQQVLTEYQKLSGHSAWY